MKSLNHNLANVSSRSVQLVDHNQFTRVKRATDLAVERILSKGSDDVFRPPLFSQSIESELLQAHRDEFRAEAGAKAIKFLNIADLEKCSIGPVRRGLVIKDHNSFRQVAWLDPFDAIKYLSVTAFLFDKIESARVPKDERIVHSHRMSDSREELFDANFGYDSFRLRSAELSSERIGQWKVVTDIANFFDRIGHHPLVNILSDIGCDHKFVQLVQEMLALWAGDRRSFGIPVGSDASRILSEVILINVDAGLRKAGITFVRYVDDFRLFANTRAEALKAVETLTLLLAEEGLSLNSRKTEIFQISSTEEIIQFTNKFAAGEHEQIDLEEKVEISRKVIVSGRSSISKFYREPGKETLKKIKSIPKSDLISKFLDSSDNDVENQIKLVVKYFVYADQDIDLLVTLLDRRITSVFYISDALVKEASKFSPEKRDEIKVAIFGAADWSKCAYPLQIPILRIAGSESFFEPRFIQDIVDAHLQQGNMLFYREAISLGYRGLDRVRLRKLATTVFENTPNFVQRAIYRAIKEHTSLTDSEKRPLLKTMQQTARDWFVDRI